MKYWILAFVLLMTPAFAGAQEGLSIAVVPQGVLPVGTMSGDFGFGAGAELSMEYRMPFAEWLIARAGAGYLTSKNALTTENLSMIPLYAGVGVIYPPDTRLKGFLAAGGGYGLGMYTGEGGGSLYLRGDAGLRFSVSPSLSLGIGANYQIIASDPEPLFQGIGIGLHLAYAIGGAGGRSRIEYRDIRLEPVFPVFYRYYNDNPLGGVTVLNGESGRIEDVRISFFVRRFMDEPKLAATLADLKKGEARTIPLYALFNADVLSITEGDTAAGRIVMDYVLQGEDRHSELPVTLEFQHRNAITWDDDRKVAAFVTANDPDIIRFSNAVAGTVREDGGRSVNLDLSIGMAMFEALGVQGLDYVIDPSSSYAELSQNEFAVDYLKYPGETLFYGAGDCDDLSTCYNALLTSVGIETAYITVPGHIFAAFAVNIEPDEARRTFRDPENLILRDNRVWIPVETTMVNEGFLEAWAAGAKQWRDQDAVGRAVLLPVREAQAVYSPVGASQAGDVTVPSPSDILEAYASEHRRFIMREIADREDQLKSAVDRSGGDPRDLNRLGLLYARYGLYDQAEAPFRRAADAGYAPAMVNLGNIRYLTGSYREAADTYMQALESSPEHPRALVGLAKAQYEMENLGDVRRTYAMLAEKHPNLADKYAYLGGSDTHAARAGALDYREVTEWDE